ncbi:MAG: hypothetical protein QNK11_06575 [Legionella sp.]|nr:hypothetical protein [Legionella sp.]
MPNFPKAITSKAARLLEQKLALESPEEIRVHPKKKKLVSKARRHTESFKHRAQDTKNKYCMEVYVTDTSEENGPGHVSTSMIKILEGQDVEVVAHMSYMPIAGGAIVNAPFLGTIPVPSENLPDSARADDVKSASTLIRFDVTKEDFQKGLKELKKITSAVDEGSNLYSVTGSLNFITVGLTYLIGCARASEATFKQHKQETGLAPLEDSFGFLISHVDMKVPEQAVYNCTSAAQSVIESAIGKALSKRILLPASLGLEVLTQVPGAKKVDSSKAPPKTAKSEDDALGDDFEIKKRFDK